MRWATTTTPPHNNNINNTYPVHNVTRAIQVVSEYHLAMTTKWKEWGMDKGLVTFTPLARHNHKCSLVQVQPTLNLLTTEWEAREAATYTHTHTDDNPHLIIANSRYLRYFGIVIYICFLCFIVSVFDLYSWMWFDVWCVMLFWSNAKRWIDEGNVKGGSCRQVSPPSHLWPSSSSSSSSSCTD